MIHRKTVPERKVDTFRLSKSYDARKWCNIPLLSVKDGHISCAVVSFYVIGALSRNGRMVMRPERNLGDFTNDRSWTVARIHKA